MTGEAIRETLRPLLRKARDEGKWLWCGYQSLWFSPDELDAQHNEGNFLWGPINWELRNPQDRVQHLERQIKHAKVDLTKFKLRIKAWQESTP